MGFHTAKIQELRAQRTLIDQAIAALEQLDGVQPSSVVVHVASRPALAAAAVPAAAPKRGRHMNPTQTDDKILRILRQRNKPMRPKDVMLLGNLSKGDATRAARRLKDAGKLVVTGKTLNALWALPSTAKEAP